MGQLKVSALLKHLFHSGCPS